MNLDSLFAVYAAGEVQRCHTHRVLVRQSIADHSWGVAMLIMWLHNGDAPSHLLQAALMHDVPEHVTGDTPAVAKWNSPQLSNVLGALEDNYHTHHGIHCMTDLDTDELSVLKIADSAELVLYCIVEMQMGNGRVKQMARNALGVIQEQLNKIVAEEQVPAVVITRARYLYGRLAREVGYTE